MYHISKNGRDKSMCGKTADSACKSLNYLLSIYYKKVPKHGLSIITSKSLIINQQIMVSQLFLRIPTHLKGIDLK